MTKTKSKILCACIAVAIFLCLFWGILAISPLEVSAAHSLSPALPTSLIVQGDVTQLEPLYDAAGATTVIDGEDHTLTKNYTGANAALITVNGKMTINDLTIDGNCGVKITSGEWSATKTSDTQPLIRVKSGATLTLVNCTVKNNYSLYGGGGIDVDQGGKLIIINSTVEYCMSNTIGGGIYSEGSVEIRSGNIQYNYAGSGGGGIGANNITLAADSMYLTIGNTANPGKINISGNRTDGNGGGIYAGGKNNSGTSPLNTTYYGWFTVKSSNASYPINISGNIAGKPGELTGSGGGIYVKSINVLVDGVVNIEGNQASSDGGGIYGDVFKIGKDGFAQKVMITGNQARYGGGIYSHDYAHIGKATISGNSATAFGGGIYVISNDSANPVAFHGVSLTSATLIKNNTAGVSGGAIHSHAAGVHLNTIPCIKDNTLRNGTPDNVYLTNNACFVMESSNVTMTADSGEMAVKIGVSGASVSSGAANIRSYLTYNWEIVGGSITPADLFKSESERLAIGEELLNGEGAACYCFKITYNPNGGTGEAFSEYYSTEPNFITLNTDHGFTKTGHTLDSWKVPSLGGNVSNGAQINTGVGDDYDLYANWTANTYILTCDYQDGSAPQKVTATYGAQMPFPTRDKGGYILKGWAWKPDAGEDEIIDRYSYYEYTEDKTVYAVWRLRGTILTLDGNGGTDETAHIRWGSTEYGDLDPLVLPTREGHKFLGYTLTKDGIDYLLTAAGKPQHGVEGYTYGSNWHYGADGQTYELTLYAKWQIESYRINYDKNGGTLSSYYVTRAYGSNYNLATPARTGYTFTGWYLPDGSRAEGTVGDLGEDGAEITVTAGWEESELTSLSIAGNIKNAYYLGEEFDANGATLTATYDNGESVTGIEITPAMLTGFSTVDIVTNATATITYETLTVNFTYSASAKPINITFSAGGATGSLPMIGGSSVVAGGEITLPDAEQLSKTGYHFAGWSASSDGRVYSAGSSLILPGEDLTLTAVWKLDAPGVAELIFDGSALTAEANNKYLAELIYDGTPRSAKVSGTHALDASVTYTYAWYRAKSSMALPPYYTAEMIMEDTANFAFVCTGDTVQTATESGSYEYYCIITATLGEDTSRSFAALRVRIDNAKANAWANVSGFTYGGGTIDLANHISTSESVSYTLTVKEKVGVAFDLSGTQITNITEAGGSFTVTVSMQNGVNHAAASVDLTFTLDKASQSITIVQPADTYYVKTPYTFTLDGAKGAVSFVCNEKGENVEVAIVNGIVTIGNRGVDGKVVLTAVSAETPLYNRAETSITIYAQKLTAEEPSPLPSGLSLCTGLPLSAAALPDGYVWKNGAVVMDTLGVQSALAVYTPEDSVNFDPVEVLLTVTVKPHAGGTATCRNLAVCEVCNRTYGTLGGHTFSDTYLAANSDAERHYHVCTVSGCSAKDEGEVHTPNAAAATEETAKYCTICQYVIENKLNHTHTYGETADAHFLKTAATCTAKAVYYKSCACGDIGSETFEYGAVDEEKHTGSATKQVNRGNGTHDIVYTCCDAAESVGVACTAGNADSDCTTAELCACGYVTAEAKEHATAIKADKNGTLHTLECTNEGCHYEADAPHSFDREEATSSYQASEADCKTPASYYKSCACGRAGEETFAHGEVDGDRHTGQAEKLVNNQNGTHDIVFTCCDAAESVGVACTAGNADSDCTTAELCACGYVTAEAKEHATAIKADKNGTHHTLECINEGCHYEADAPHSFDREEATSSYQASEADCKTPASYYKSCACGRAGEETFAHGEVDGDRHTGQAEKLINNQNGTHDIVYTCCDAVATDNVNCTEKDADSDCTTAELCACGYTFPAASEHDFADACDASCNNEDCLYTRSITHSPKTDGDDCTADVLCTLCGGLVTEGNKSHTWSETYLLANADENKHYHVCTVKGCMQKDGGEAHNPSIPAATEEAAKVCTVCGYVIEAQIGHGHVYDQKVTSEAYLVPGAEATCQAPARYYYSCVCGSIENVGDGEGNTFEHGEPDESEHTGQAEKLINNQNGTHDLVYTCCDAVVNDNVNCTEKDADSDCTTAEVCACGYTFPAASEHAFTNACDASCNNEGCLHTRSITHSPKTDGDDCTADVLCTLCGALVTEGKESHTWSETYLLANADENKHYHVCTVSGCMQKDSGEAHIPSIPAATEEAAKVCTACGYEMEARLVHTHLYNREIASEGYKASNGTCTSGALYYKSCTCGAHGTETFEGARDGDNHASTDFTYTDNGNGTHAKKHACCLAVAEASLVCVYEADVCKYCGHEKEAAVMFTVTVAGGTVIGNGGASVTVSENSSVTVQANAAPEGEVFKGWSVNGSLVSTEESYTFRATEDISLTAVYEKLGGEVRDPEGLSVGVIVAIVLASVAALAGGGFAVYWFILRKRK